MSLEYSLTKDELFRSDMETLSYNPTKDESKEYLEDVKSILEEILEDFSDNDEVNVVFSGGVMYYNVANGIKCFNLYNVDYELNCCKRL